MAHLTEGGPARMVPLTYYDDKGNRYVVGKVKAKLREGCVVVEAALESTPNNGYSHEFNIDYFDFEPFKP